FALFRRAALIGAAMTHRAFHGLDAALLAEHPRRGRAHEVCLVALRRAQPDLLRLLTRLGTDELSADFELRALAFKLDGLGRASACDLGLGARVGGDILVGIEPAAGVLCELEGEAQAVRLLH